MYFGKRLDFFHVGWQLSDRSGSKLVVDLLTDAASNKYMSGEVVSFDATPDTIGTSVTILRGVDDVTVHAKATVEPRACPAEAGGHRNCAMGYSGKKTPPRPLTHVVPPGRYRIYRPGPASGSNVSLNLALIHANFDITNWLSARDEKRQGDGSGNDAFHDDDPFLR